MTTNPPLVDKMVIVAAGKDRTGIVAGLGECLFEHNVNLEDTSMVQLADYFTVMMVVTSPSFTAEALKQELVTKLPDLLIDVFDAKVNESRPRRSGQPWLFSITSDDHAGIVYHVCRWLAEQGGNIYQLGSRRLPQDPPKKTLFLLTIEADMPDGVDEEEMLQQLAALAKAQQLDIQAHPLETFLL